MPEVNIEGIRVLDGFKFARRQCDGVFVFVCVCVRVWCLSACVCVCVCVWV